MPRFDFVEWMKALGITLIVYGHVATASTLSWTRPIYVKQLGVAFFLFVAGFTLARERRPTFEALVTRLFPVYLFGLATAGFITLIGVLSGTGVSPGSGLALSNYLPFLGGANVVFDNFPANPTTWYLGTYLHVLLLWAGWLRGVRFSPRFAFVGLLIEIPVRAALMQWAGGYIAYMLVTNWITVFLLGLAFGCRPDTLPQGSAFRYITGLAGILTVWATIANGLDLTSSFPFMTLRNVPGVIGLGLVSAMVSGLYVVSTLLVFGMARRLPAPSFIRFLARNSLIIFLLHMPVFLGVHELMPFELPYWWRVAVHLFVCLVLLGLLSELLVRMVGPKTLGEQLVLRLRGWHTRAERVRPRVSS